jgi:hypothetical protein
MKDNKDSLEDNMRDTKKIILVLLILKIIKLIIVIAILIIGKRVMAYK